MQESSFMWTLCKVKYCWKNSGEGEKSIPISWGILGFAKMKKSAFLIVRSLCFGNVDKETCSFIV